MRERQADRRWPQEPSLGWCATACLLALVAIQGCAALRPLKGIPVAELPEEYAGQTRSGQETIDLKQLVQVEPAEYRVDSGDVLGIYIENAFPKSGDIPPVYYPNNNESPPAMGYPVPVRDDGTITLPYIGRQNVRGLTEAQIEDLLHRSFSDKQQFIEKDRLNITVAVQKRRTYQVLVIRQEATSPTSAGATGMGSINLGEVKRGTGQVVNLQAYRNDVLHALAQTGGLPGLDAENAIYILRGAGKGKPLPPMGREPWPPQAKRQGSDGGTVTRHVVARAQSPEEFPILRGQSGWSNRYGFAPNTSEGTSSQGMSNSGYNNGGRYGMLMPLPERNWNAPPQGEDPLRFGWDAMQNPPGTAEELINAYGDNTEVIRIPVRLFPGEELEFDPEDIILYDGDIVFIESRETEIFYTGGLLGGGQYTLPRDYDLDVLGAVSIANGRQQSNTNSSGFGSRVGGISATNQDISVSASTVIVLRQTPDGGQIPIKVNLYKAMRSPAERVLIMPGDHIILQYTPIEALGAFIERNLLAGSLIGLATQQNGGGN